LINKKKLTLSNFLLTRKLSPSREKTQSLAVLRVVEFAEMTKQNVKLLRIVLCQILMQKDEQDVVQIFQVILEKKKESTKAQEQTSYNKK
jgi:hypothetical protein